MKKRIGKSYLIRWSVTTNKKVIPLSGRNLTLYLYSPKGEKYAVEEWSREDNKAVFTFKPTIQECFGLGTYSLTMIENEDSEESRSVVDHSEFITLVDRTEKETPSTIPDNIDVEEVIELGDDDIEIGMGGGGGVPVDAYTKAETNELLKRKQDVIDDLESIREGAERGKTALQEHQDISGKVDKEDGKGLSSNDYTDDDRKKVANALTEHQSLDGKVDKVSGKQLSTEDFTTEYKSKLEGLSNYNDSDVRGLISKKQDYISDIATIRSGASAGASAVQPAELNSYVRKDGNKVLSDNNYTDADKQKVANALTEHQSLAGYAKTTDIPTTLPASDVSEWAKKPNKPTYTASEVGALPSSTTIPTKTSQLQNDSNYLTEHQSLAGYEKVVDVINVSEDTLSISVGSQTSDKDYKCGVLNSLSVTSVTAINKEVNIFFSTGDSVENMPSIPADAKVVGEIELNINKSYVMSIYQGVICCQEIK